MMRRLAALAAFVFVAVVLAAIDAFGNGVLIALAVLAWGVYFATVRKGRRA